MRCDAREPRGEVVGALEHADLLVEAVEEADVARLVGDLRREEDPHVLGRRRAHDRPELVGDPLLADEERREPVHAGVPLLGRDPLVPVDPVLGEVEVLGRPLLALPELVELRVAEQLEPAPVGALLQRGIPGREEVLALGDRAQGLRAGFHLALRREKPNGWRLRSR